MSRYQNVVNQINYKNDFLFFPAATGILVKNFLLAVAHDTQSGYTFLYFLLISSGISVRFSELAQLIHTLINFSDKL